MIGEFYDKIVSLGILTLFVLGLVGALIGIFSPVEAILFMLVGLLFSLFIGLISLTFFIGIGSLGGIVFYFIKKAHQRKTRKRLLLKRNCQDKRDGQKRRLNIFLCFLF